MDPDPIPAGPHPCLPQGEGVDSIVEHSTPLPWEGQGGGSGRDKEGGSSHRK